MVDGGRTSVMDLCHFDHLSGRRSCESSNDELECEDEENEAEWNQILDWKGCPSSEMEANAVDKNQVAGVSCDTAIHSDDKCDTVVVACDNPVTRMALNDHKAGMDGLDKDKINKIIHDASKGSKFYENEVRKEQKVSERIEAMMLELMRYTEDEKRKAFNESNKVLKDLENYVDFTRTLVHVDMDAFYAAVETRDNPALKDVPMAVGSNAMLCTSNYAARKYGVRAAMPGFIAKKLCPQLLIVPTNFDKYRKVSAEVQEIFQEYDPNFSAVSLDEAYLDLTEYMQENFMKYDNDVENRDLSEIILQEMRTKIFEKTKLTASAGIACNTMLAKICSDMNKPNGQYYLKPDADIIKTFMKDLPIRKINGIGRVTEQMLKGLNVEKCNDLLENRAILYLLFSYDTFRYFMKVALGISSNRITHGERKSMSAERTFQNVSDKDRLLEICYDICKHLAEDLKRKKLKGYNVTLKYKLSSFVTRTRSKTISYPVSQTEELYKLSKELLLKEIQSYSPKKFELRLMGVRVCNFDTKSTRKQQTVETLLMSKVHTTEKKWESTSGKHSNEYGHSQAGLNLLDDSETVEIDSNHSSNADICQSTSFECPVCGKPQGDTVTLNLHIDDCLRSRTKEPGDKVVGNKGREAILGHRSTSHEHATNNITPDTLYDHNLLEDEHSTVECPVCGQPQKNDELTLNIHIDNCLSKKTIVEIIRDQETLGNCIQGTGGERKTDNENFVKQNEQGNSKSNSSSKRKNNELVSKKKKKVTLHTFWERE